MHNRWEVFRGDSANASDLLFTVKKSSMIQFKTEMDVFLAGNTAQQVCDFKIKGNYFDRSCAFYLGNSTTMVAQVSSTRIGPNFSSYFEAQYMEHLADKFGPVLLQMNRKFTISNVLLDRDTFIVTVFPHVDYVFIATLVVILDEVHREKFDQ
jgi:hypothetical protein